LSGEQGVEIFIHNISNFLLPWPRRPITMSNETIKIVGGNIYYHSRINEYPCKAIGEGTFY
jgi:hypothetical protein